MNDLVKRVKGKEVEREKEKKTQEKTGKIENFENSL